MSHRTADTALRVRDLFDVKAAAWPLKYAPDGRLAGRLTLLAKAVSHYVPVGGSVLDFGCGTGDLAASLAAAGLRVTGCDISPEMLHWAASADSAREINWVQLDPAWGRLPFEPGTFDAVVASSVLEYVDDPVAVLRECRRMLRPGGLLLCTVPNARHPVRWLEWLVGRAAREPVVRAASRRPSRLAGYLSYLQVSQQRHSLRWWQAAAARAGLPDGHDFSDSSKRVPLRLLTFRQPVDTSKDS
jgi:SAM-dependent methyltransferase